MWVERTSNRNAQFYCLPTTPVFQLDSGPWTLCPTADGAPDPMTRKLVWDSCSVKMQVVHREGGGLVCDFRYFDP